MKEIKINRHFLLRCFIYAVIVTCAAISNGSAAQAAFEVQTIETEQGAKAWLIEDQTSEVISLRLSFPSGIANEAEGLEGLASLLSDLLIEGAGDFSGVEFQRLLEEDSISLSFSAGRDAFFMQMAFVKAYQDKAVKLANLALTRPTFDSAAMERAKEQQISSLRQQQARPQWQLWRNFNNHFFAGHVYSRPGQGTEGSINKITDDDLHHFMKDGFCQQGVKAALVGALDRDDVSQLLNNLLQGVSVTCALPKIDAVSYPETPQQVMVDLDIPQSFILLGWQGIGRDDPDWYAAQIANYILGGGGFSSRLMQRIRVEEGLTYGINSSLAHYQHGDIFFIRTSTEARNKERAIATIYEEISKFLESGTDAKTLNDAKTYLINSYVTAMTSSSEIAALYHGILFDDLSPTYLAERRHAFNAVTGDDVRRVLARLFKTEMLTDILDEDRAEGREAPAIKADLTIIVQPTP